MCSPLCSRSLLTGFLLVAFGGTVVVAGKAQLNSKAVFEGELIPVKGLTPTEIKRKAGPTETFPIFMVHSGFKRYFVPRLQLDWKNTDQSTPLGGDEYFLLKQPLANRKPGFSMVGGYSADAWSPFGRRTAKISTPKGTIGVVQGVTRITPKYVEVEGITHEWKFGLAVTSLAPETIAALIGKATDRKNPADRMTIVRYYIQAGHYEFASKELELLEKDFPEQKKNAEEARFQLRQLTAKKIITELKLRRTAGQHRLVYASCRAFPKNDVTAAVLREIEQIKKEYDDAQSTAERALMLLMDLEAELKDPKKIAAVRPIRSEISARLDYESLSRLDAFLKLSADNTLPADEKLSLAYSGWMLGSGHADTKLDVAIQLWEARFLMMKYLRTESITVRNDIVAQLKKLEGVKPEMLGFMVANLPPIIETPEAKPGQPQLITVAGRKDKPAIRYAVLLPPEYNPHHSYPVMMALHPRERNPQAETEWWGGTATKPGQAQRHGYIVIAPEYTDGKSPGYDYSAHAHEAVIESLRDARKRFHIDSDRVFLSGHGSGGDAAFDLAMSHPDLFAGCIPIVGVIDKYSKRSYENARHLPWYIVGGELARNAMERNAFALTKMMTSSINTIAGAGTKRIPGNTVFDVIYCEYIGRGYESYYEEIHQLFDWMELHRRRKFPKRMDVAIQRPSENRFWWVHLDGFPRNVLQPNTLDDKLPNTQPMPFSAQITSANAILITSGAAVHTLWLSPELVDYGKEVTVRVSRVSSRLFHDFVSREIDTMLEDLRVRGDRQKLYWTRLVITRGGVRR